MSQSGGPIMGSCQKWSITKTASKPLSSAATATSATRSNWSSGATPSYVKRGICRDALSSSTGSNLRPGVELDTEEGGRRADVPASFHGAVDDGQGRRRVQVPVEAGPHLVQHGTTVAAPARPPPPVEPGCRRVDEVVRPLPAVPVVVGQHRQPDDRGVDPVEEVADEDQVPQ